MLLSIVLLFLHLLDSLHQSISEYYYETLPRNSLWKKENNSIQTFKHVKTLSKNVKAWSRLDGRRQDIPVSDGSGVGVRVVLGTRLMDLVTEISSGDLGKPGQQQRLDF